MVPLIVLAADDPEATDRVQAALGLAGFEVVPAGSRDEVLSLRPGRVPDLVLVEERIPGAEDLTRTFSRCRGGPGVVLLMRGARGTDPPPGLQDADLFLGESYSAQELIEAVRSRLSLESAGRAGDGFEDEDRVYTTEEIFGDIISELSDLGKEADLEDVLGAGRESLSRQYLGEIEETLEGEEQELPQPVTWVAAAPEAPRENELKEGALDPARSIEEPLSGEALLQSLAESRPAPPEKPAPPERPVPSEEPPPPAALNLGSEKILPVFYGPEQTSEKLPPPADVTKEVDWMLAALMKESEAGVASLGISSLVHRDEKVALDSLQRLVRDDVAPIQAERSLAAGAGQSAAELFRLPDSDAGRSRESPSPGLAGTVAGVAERSESQDSDQPTGESRSRWAAVWKRFADPLDLGGRHRASEVGGDASHFLGGDSIDE